MEDERYRQDGFGQYDELWDNSIMEQFEEEPIQITLPEKSKKGRKEMLSLLLIAAMVLSTAVWCLWSGMKGLFFAPVHPMEEVFTGMIKGEVYEGEIVYASKEYCSLKHTINLIPAGTEHFYLMYALEMDKVILIRAPKGWDKNFTNDLVYYNVDTTGGNSGSPAYITETVRGKTFYTVIGMLNSGDLMPNPKYNFGVKYKYTVEIGGKSHEKGVIYYHISLFEYVSIGCSDF